MKNPNFLEKQLESWTPRRPSAKVAARLFPRRENGSPTMGLSRNPNLWNWLTPMAACSLALLVVWHNFNAPQTDFQGSEDSSLYAAYMLAAPAHSNSPRQTFALCQSDANLEWNSPPKLLVGSTTGHPDRSHASLRPLVATNGFIP